MTPIHKFKRAITLPLSACALAALVACGGGGDSSSGTSGASLSGIATKGLVRLGVVRAYGVTGTGAIDRSRVLAQDVTDNEGAYELTGLPTGVTVVVEITAGADTKIVDEATDEVINPPTGFALRAATVLDSGETVSDRTLQITPFSEMAVVAAEEKEGGLSGVNVANSNADVRTLVGFDVLSEKPEFDNDGETPTNRAALLLASVSEMASAGALGCDGDSQADRIKCVVAEMADRGPEDDALVTALNTAKDDAQENESYEGETLPDVAKVETPSSLSQAQIEGVAAAKALIASLRNNAQIIDGSNPESLESRLTAVDDAYSAAIEPINDNQQNFLVMLSTALTTLARQSEVFPSNGFRSIEGGGCFLYPQDPLTAVSNVDPATATSWATTRYAACYMYAASVPGTRDEVYYEFDITVPAVATSPYTIISRLAKYGPNDTPASALELKGTFKAAINDPSVIRSSATFTLANGDITGVSLTGDLVPKVNTNGSLTTGYERMGVNLVLSPSTGSNPTTLNIRGEFAAKNSSGTATTTVGLREGSYIRANLNTAGQIGSGVANNTATAGRFDMIGQLNTGESINGVVEVSDFVADNTGDEVPSKASFEGVIKGSAGGLVFSGKLAAAVSNVAQVNTNQNESSSNFFKKTLTVNGILGATATKPQAEVALSLANNLTFGNYTLTGSYGVGANALNLSAVYSDNNNATDDSFTVQSSTGVSVVLNDVDSTFNITRSGALIGILDRPKKTVFYKDNTSESF